MRKNLTLQQKYNKAIKENRRLKMLAYQDDLTGLPNNRAFEQSFSEAVGKSEPFALLFLDVDNFGQLNKTYSHKSADEVVRQIAFNIQNGIRRQDKFIPAKQTLVARYAGDEFFILLSHADVELAYQVAERLRKKIQRSTYYLDEERTYKLPQKITVSIGAAIYPFHGRTENALRDCVEKGLQIAKKQGKAQVALAPKEEV